MTSEQIEKEKLRLLQRQLELLKEKNRLLKEQIYILRKLTGENVNPEEEKEEKEKDE